MKYIYGKFQFLKSIQILKYLYLNYFSKKIIRKGKGKIIPFRGAVINLEVNSRIYIKDGNLEIGVNKLKGSKAETYVRLRQGSVWKANNGCAISYGSTIEILHDGRLQSEYFTMNSFSTLIAKKDIELGNDVMIARNVVIFDSDFHPVRYEGRNSECSEKVKIGNHVWIGANAIILKGVDIGDNSMVSANTLVAKTVMPDTLVGNQGKLIILKRGIHWNR